MVSAIDSVITATAFSHSEVAALFSDEAEVRALIKVEQELVRVQSALGIIPDELGQEIFSKLEVVNVNPEALTAGFDKDGIVIPGLLGKLREHIGHPAADYLHFGATSHDILDTALIIRTRAAIAIIERDLALLNAELAALASEHRSSLMLGRTRNQNAAPIVFGLKVTSWLTPLQRQRQRLQELTPRLLAIQFGGAVGTNAALGDEGDKVSRALAEALELNSAVTPWHVQRDSIVEFGNWLSLTANSIVKIAQDILLMAQSEVREISFVGTGKSSTMPNKSNPVLAETLISLATFCRSNADLLSQSLAASHERDGVSMNIERLAFPQLICAASAAIANGIRCISSMQVNKQAMLDNLEADNGRVLAEAAVFALSKLLSKAEASKLVAEACNTSLINNKHMIDELQKICSVETDWERLRKPENYLGSATEIIDSILQKNN